jgi:hypothetical protein
MTTSWNLNCMFVQNAAHTFIYHKEPRKCKYYTVYHSESVQEGKGGDGRETHTWHVQAWVEVKDIMKDKWSTLQSSMQCKSHIHVSLVQRSQGSAQCIIGYFSNADQWPSQLPRCASAIQVSMVATTSSWYPWPHTRVWTCHWSVHCKWWLGGYNLIQSWTTLKPKATFQSMQSLLCNCNCFGIPTAVLACTCHQLSEVHD